ncbi:MAG TPA: DUF4157 domain-containing protein [Polyangia bacterium]|nr:DUF4157 domain-containing protein [Polyangia bacterium]
MSEGGFRHKPGADAGAKHDADAERALPGEPPENPLSPASRYRTVTEQRSRAGEQIRRKLAAEQRGAEPAGKPRVPAASGALDEGTRAKMEGALGARLGDVKVGTGAESARAAQGFGARAFTVGKDVHFGAGQFAPGTREGDRLIAHELTHVVQGERAGVQRKSEPGPDAAAGGAADEHDVSEPHDASEQEADAVADGATRAIHDHKGGAAPDDKKGAAPDDKKSAAPDDKKGAAPAGADKQEEVKQPAPRIAAKRATIALNRVDEPKKGVYPENTAAPSEKKPVKTPNRPEKLIYTDRIDDKDTNGNPIKMATTVEVEGRGTWQGSVSSRLQQKPTGHEVVFENGNLDKIPKEMHWVTETGDVSLVEGKGTPLYAYLQMRQMRIMGIKYGEMGNKHKKVRGEGVMNVETLKEVNDILRADAAAGRKRAPTFEEIKTTKLYKFTETPIVQAGGKIVGCTFENYLWIKNSDVTPEKRHSLGLPDVGEHFGQFDIIYEVAVHPKAEEALPTKVSLS